MTENKPDNFLLPLVMLAMAFVILLLTIYPFYKQNNPSTTRPIAIPTVNIFKYTCPSGQWVDCLPGPGPTKPQCQPGYLEWAKINCPNFKGAAL
jgi:hypothetical protein